MNLRPLDSARPGLGVSRPTGPASTPAPADSFSGSVSTELILSRPQFATSPPDPLRRIDAHRFSAIQEGLSESSAEQQQSLWQNDPAGAEKMEADVANLLSRLGVDPQKSFKDLSPAEQDRRATLALLAGWCLCDPKQPFDAKDPTLRDPESLCKPKSAEWAQGLSGQLDKALADPEQLLKQIKSIPVGAAGDVSLTQMGSMVAKFTQGFRSPTDSYVDASNVLAGAILRKLQTDDKLLQTLMPSDPMPADVAKRSLAEKLKGWSTTRGYSSSPIHNVAAGAFVVGAGGVLAKVGLAAAAAASAPAAILTGAAALVALRVGYSIADLGSGVLVHQPHDQFLTSRTARAFQWHHINKEEIGKWGIGQCVFHAAKVAAPVALAAAALPIHGALAAVGVAGFTGMLVGAVVGQLSHKYAHMENPPLLARLGQKAGLLGKPEVHEAHHADGNPIDDYCIVTGEWNPILKKYHVAQMEEKLVYLATGLKAHDWLVDPSMQVDAMKVKIPGQKWVVDGFRGVAKLANKLSGRTSGDPEAEKLAYQSRLEEARLAES